MKIAYLILDHSCPSIPKALIPDWRVLPNTPFQNPKKITHPFSKTKKVCPLFFFKTESSVDKPALVPNKYCLFP